jgi:hypothetical protein
LCATSTKTLSSTSVVAEWWIIGGAEQPRRLYHWYASGKQGPKHHLIEMTAGNATADYPSSALPDRNQARKDLWKN